MRVLRRGGALSGWLALLCPLAAYVATLAPGIEYWDTGEMQTVPYVLGISHPTGFPFFVIAGWVFTHVVALGEPAWRSSLYCAVAVAVAALALWWFVRDLTASPWVACATAVVFSLGDIIWSHAVHAEVHDVALATIALALALALRAGTTQSRSAVYAAAAALGCAIATHPVALFAAPSVAILAWRAAWPSLSRCGAAIAIALIIPVCAYAYLPLRSNYVIAHHLDPAQDAGVTGGAIFNDGAPATPSALVHYLSGADFHATSALADAFLGRDLDRVVAYAVTAAGKNAGPLFLGLGVVGLVALFFARRRVAFAMLPLPFLIAAFTANYPVESDTDRYAMPALWLVAACAGYGAAWVGRAIFGTERSAVGSGLAVAMLALALYPRVLDAPRAIADRVGSQDARAVGPTVEANTVDDSLIIASWSFVTPLLYERYAAHHLGTRHILSGWPTDFPGRYPAWLAQFKHVYFVLPQGFAPGGATLLTQNGVWELLELRH